jgi:hypothetical protein
MGDAVLRDAEQLVLQLLEADEDAKDFVSRYEPELQKDMHKVQAVTDIVRDWPEFQIADKTSIDFARQYPTKHGYILEWNAALYWENLAALTGIRTGADDPPQMMESYSFIDENDDYREIHELENVDRRRALSSLVFLQDECRKFKARLATAVKFIDARPSFPPKP